MRKFNVRVNGVDYVVEVEESDTQVSATATIPDHMSNTPVVKTVKHGGTEVKSPIQGTVLKYNVNIGDKVQRGDCVCVLEAMKMEYDIAAPEDGTLATIDAPHGSAVNDGQLLFTLGS